MQISDCMFMYVKTVANITEFVLEIFQNVKRFELREVVLGVMNI